MPVNKEKVQEKIDAWRLEIINTNEEFQKERAKLDEQYKKVTDIINETIGMKEAIEEEGKEIGLTKKEIAKKVEKYEKVIEENSAKIPKLQAEFRSSNMSNDERIKKLNGKISTFTEILDTLEED